MVSIGMFVTVRVSGEAGVHPETLRSAVSAQLQVFPLRVLSFELQGPTIGSALANPWLHYTYDGTIVMQTAGEFTDAGDITSLVNHAFYVTTGFLPAASSESVSSRAPTLADHPVSGVWESLTSGVSNIASGLQVDTQLVILGAIVIVIVLVVVVGPIAVKTLV